MGTKKTRPRRVPWWLWLSLLVLWTGLLIAPGSWFGEKPPPKIGEIGLGKLLHIGAYMISAASAGWLPAPMTVRLALIPALMLHGGLTELIQMIVPGRDGNWWDMALDGSAVFAGFLFSFWFWPGSPASGDTIPTTGRP